MDAATIGFLVYLGATILLLITLSMKAYTISGWKNKSSFLKAVRSMRSIYGTVLVHLYDTSTDIAILISWGILTSEEISGKTNHENVNMLSFLIPSILLIFIYRGSYAMIHWTSFKGTEFSSKRDIILILLDLYIFVLVYDQFSLQYISPCMMQKKLQLLESVFESMPQLVMQSIFLIRTYNTKLAESESMYIVFASIIASLLSIVTKFLNDDHEWVTKRAASLHFTHKRLPCISISYLFVVLWRFCESIARFSIFTLLWAVVGGIYLPLYLLLSIVIYFYLEKYTDLVWIVINKYANRSKRHQVRKKILLIYVLQSIVGIPLRYKPSMIFIRFVDNCIILGIIYSFAFMKFDCILCYDKSERNALYNPYILALLLVSGVTTILSFVVYLGLYAMDIVREDRQKVDVQIVGMDQLGQNDHERAAIYPKLYEKALKQKQKSIQGNMHIAHKISKVQETATPTGDVEEGVDDRNNDHDLEVVGNHKSIINDDDDDVMKRMESASVCIYNQRIDHDLTQVNQDGNIKSMEDSQEQDIEDVMHQMREAGDYSDDEDNDVMDHMHQASIC